MASSDITVEILRGIRDEMRGMRAEQVQTNQRLEVVTGRLDTVDATLREFAEHADRRLATVETALLDLAQQQRFVVRYTRTISERDVLLESRLTNLESRVEKLETK